MPTSTVAGAPLRRMLRHHLLWVGELGEGGHRVVAAWATPQRKSHSATCNWTTWLVEDVNATPAM
jgi:hypothetical protein